MESHNDYNASNHNPVPLLREAGMGRLQGPAQEYNCSDPHMSILTYVRYYNCLFFSQCVY